MQTCSSVSMSGLLAMNDAPALISACLPFFEVYLCGTYSIDFFYVCTCILLCNK